MRWYELRRPGDQPLVYQQGTYAPADRVNRWMGSIAQDKKGNMALGYSVSNGANVFPGIRYTGRLRNDVANQMPQGEAVIVNGGGSQTDPAARWGDYTSMKASSPGVVARTGRRPSPARSGESMASSGCACGHASPPPTQIV
jgi:hypothetical protein